jgi:hypothetical protein
VNHNEGEPVTAASVKLTANELDKALAILKTHGCSDFFPPAFEIEAVEHSWNKVRPVLESVDLLCYTPHAALKMVAPRQRYTTRAIKLLDPIDTLLATALCLRILPSLHSARENLSTKCVFSCRFDAELPDQLFDFKTDYLEFKKVLDNKLAAASFVATADINDFYPRIYLHRLENGLDAILGPDNLETRCVMRFVEAWAEGTSYGIPVGPHFTHVFGESTLHEVDSYLPSRGVSFIRFMDDFYIFGDTEAECLRGLYLLGSRLQDTQGLSLNSAKTRVWQSQQLKKRLDLEDRPDAKLRKEIVDKVFGGNPYVHVEYDKLTPEQKDLLVKCDLAKIMRATLEEESLTDFSPVKFILLVLTAINRPELTDLVLDNLSRLYPVAPFVARFFSVLDAVDSKDRSKIGGRLLKFITESGFVPDFQSMWLMNPFVQSNAWNNLDSIRSLASNHTSRLVRRQAILAIGQSTDRSAILDAKVRVTETTDWEHRAVIYACRNLPPDEKRAFLDSLGVTREWRLDGLLLRALVEFCK